MYSVWINLKNSSSSTFETVVQTSEEFIESLIGIVVFFGSYTEPLYGWNADSSIKDSFEWLKSTWSEFETLSHVDLHHISLDSPFISHFHHVPTDIQSYPNMSFFTQLISTQTTPTTNVQYQLIITLKVKQFYCSFRHLRLNLYYTRVTSVFLRLLFPIILTFIIYSLFQQETSILVDSSMILLFN